MTAREILERLRSTSVLVLGDVCLDRWCRYDPALAEPSRETGIPRIAVTRTEVTAGAAGTIANNLSALGTERVAVLGLVGQDGFGFELERALTGQRISPELLVRSADVPTFTYTKLINVTNDEEDLPRVDFVNAEDLPETAESAVVERLERVWREFDVVLVSDQAETERGGVVTRRVCNTLAELAASTPDKVVWVDSRVRAEHFRNVVLKSNDDEARAACERAFGAYDLPRLAAATRSPMLVMTEGPAGVVYVRGGEPRRVATKAVEEPIDICGAGDSFNAGAAPALAISGSPEEALRFGHLVASITIMKKGTGTASPEEVLRADAAWPE